MSEKIYLVNPSFEYLLGYKAALEKGWGPDNLRPAESAKENLQKIEEDAAAFVRMQDDPKARGGPIKLVDGSMGRRLPGFHRWMWDGEFCGNMGFRWEPGTTALPPNCLGHIGYSVVPWKRQRGYATQALALLLSEIRSLGLPGLPYLELTTDPDNIPSQKVVTANGGILIGSFQKILAHGGGKGLLFRINL